MPMLAAWLWLFWVAQAPMPRIEGRVVAAGTNTPIPSAKLLSDSDYTTSDDSGAFAIHAREAIRISAPGYQPVTRFVAEMKPHPEIQLQPDGESVVRILPCGREPPGTKWVRGDQLQVAIPSAMRTRRVHDADYAENVVCVGKECLAHGFGPMWGSGFWVNTLWFTDLAEVHEKDVLDRSLVQLEGAEYRGTKKDGSLFRSVSVFNESLRYDGVSRRSAEIFDRIIDSMCWSASR